MKTAASVNDLLNLTSEQSNPRTADIDILPTAEILARINDEDKRVALAVRRELPNIERAVDRVVAALRSGGRLIYIGAGTSGRLGVLDASECPPTFSVPPDMVVGLIGGGDTALRHAVEGAEDDDRQGAADLQAIALSSSDVVVGIAASGRTPYVLGAIDHARTVGATTVGLACVAGSDLSRHVDVMIAPLVGPEVLTGSTRMKSGTAQKMVLNMISTAAMIRLGKTYRNYMVDLSISNRKLAARAVGILCDVTGATVGEAERLIQESGGDLKTAILMRLTGSGPDEARARLETSGGVLRHAIEETRSPREMDRRAARS